jgi:hypothetical protein
MVSQISSADATNNWTFCVQYSDPIVGWYWFNEANALGKQLHSVTAATFDNAILKINGSTMHLLGNLVMDHYIFI